MRRSKSAHVKCDCGEKTSKCVHLQPTVQGHRDSCCCNHGGRCTCSHKKEQSQLDTVPESDSDMETSNAKPSKPARKRRSRASTQNSDGMLLFDEHGHHKPTYKHTKPHQTSGPYQLTRGHSSHTDGSITNCSMESLADDSPALDAMSMSQAQDQCWTNSETASERASPQVTGSSTTAQSTTSVPPLDLSATQNWPSGSFTSNFDMFGPSLDELEPPMFSAGLESNTSVDWTQYGLDVFRDFGNNFAPSSYSQAPSFGGYDQPSALASGEASEVEDVVPSIGDDFESVGVFSRTNTSSTGISYNQSQENLGSTVGLDVRGDGDFDPIKISKDRFYPGSLITDDASAVAAVLAAQEMAVTEFVQNESLFWTADEDYNGAANDLPDSTVPDFWQQTQNEI